MIGRLNHVAIAVNDLAAAVANLSRTSRAPRSRRRHRIAEHGVTVVFVTLPNTKIELLEPLGEDSPIAKFLERNPDGGIHHVCYEVDDILAARDRLGAAGARVLGDGEPQDRRARQARAVPAPEGLSAARSSSSSRPEGRGCVDDRSQSVGSLLAERLRRSSSSPPRRSRRGRSSSACARRRRRTLFRGLVDLPLRRPAVRRPQPGGSGRGRRPAPSPARRAAPALREKALWTTLGASHRHSRPDA